MIAVPSQNSQNLLYRQLANQLAGLIDAGTLRPGERVPSVRQMSDRQDVSIATVTQAYRLLESRGVIEARPQSGYYVRARTWTPPAEPEMYRPKPSSTRVAVNDLVVEVVQTARDPQLIRLGAALPAAELFPVHELNRAMASVARRHAIEANSFEAGPGHRPLRVQIARRALEAGCTLSPDDIIITCGATEALNLALRAVARPGDTIAIESPTFFGILQMIESLGMKACEIPTYPRHGICLDELESRLACCKIKACVFTLNFSNPLGSCMPDEKKKKLVEILARRNIPLIEDDLYGNLYFGNQRPKVAKAFDKSGLVFTCSSFTKILAPGHRVGWIVPGKFKKQVEYLKMVTTCATATLPQMAIADFLTNGAYDHHLRKIRRFYADQMERMTESITRHFPAETKVTRPSGGQVLWVQLPEQIDSLELYRRALHEKISIAPGPIFSAKRNFHNFIRLNCGQPWSQAIECALIRLGQIMATMGGR